MNITKHIPNSCTCLNIVSGCIASVAALEGYLDVAALWIIVGAIFDFLDGLTARLLNAYSPLGKELDSLADMITFGFAPGVIVFWLLKETASALPFGSLNAFIPFLAFIIPLLSAIRLAKFNIDTRQASSFIGLPVPAHALFWSSLGCSVMPVMHNIPPVVFVLCIVTLSVLTSLLLVSGIPLFSMKAKSLGWKGNELRYIIVACAVVFIAAFGFLGITGTILLYVILSIFNKKP